MAKILTDNFVVGFQWQVTKDRIALNILKLDVK